MQILMAVLSYLIAIILGIAGFAALVGLAFLSPSQQPFRWVS